MALLFLWQVTHAQVRPLINEDFAQGITGQDLSLSVLWGRQQVPTSAFQVLPFTDRNGVTLNGVVMTPLAKRYADWHTDTTLRMLNSLDYAFPTVDRERDTLEISWDCSWDTLTNGGETGRINVILLHDYPASGPQFGWVDSLQIKNAFGRPAYHLRIVPRTLTNTYNGFMGFGGGNDTLGELYQFPTALPQFWTPGAVPGSSLPNVGAYPAGQSINLNTAISGRREWRTYTWTIYPEQMTLSWRRYNEPTSANRQVLQMTIPKEESDVAATLARFQQLGLNVGTLPQQYHWFRYVQAVRFYGVGLIDTRWGGVRVTAFGPGTTSVNAPKEATKASNQQNRTLIRVVQPGQQVLLDGCGNCSHDQELVILNHLGQCVKRMQRPSYSQNQDHNANIMIPELPAGHYWVVNGANVVQRWAVR